MLSYNELKKGTLFVLDGEPYMVMEYEFLRMQQRKPVAKTKIKNIVSGKIVERNFHQNESFEEADIEKKQIKYLYNHRDEFWFADIKDATKRFSFTAEFIGQGGQFLKPNSEVLAMVFNDNIIGIEPPIKADLKVKETPPGIRGDTAQGGTKAATLETGAVVAVPLFVNEGDVIRINTTTGDYVERVEKAKE